MRFEHVDIRNVRIFSSVSLHPARRLNIVAGANGSGKTSLLEALYLLGRGRSFRSRRIDPVVRYGATAIAVTAQIRSELGMQSKVRIYKHKQATEFSVGGRSEITLRELAKTVPVVIIEPRLHSLLDGGPHGRRRLLDWSLFHVEPGFVEAVGRYGRALRQRNALLRAYGTRAELEFWEKELAATGSHLSGSRERMLGSLNRYFVSILRETLDMQAQLRYRPGWDSAQPLAQALAVWRERDRAKGYTTPGPHRADVEVEIAGTKAGERLSRGQSKVFVSSLLAAHVQMVSASGAEPPVVMVDDFSSELDADAAARLLSALCRLDSQLFLTTTDRALIPDDGIESAAVFHVKHGDIAKVV